MALIDDINPVSKQIFASLPGELQREVFEQRGFCSPASLEDLIQKAALENLEEGRKSLRAWNQRANAQGWGTGARGEDEQEWLDAAAEDVAAAGCIDPLDELLAFEVAAARLTADPSALGRAQRSADLEPRTGRAREVACRGDVTVRRAQQLFDMRREAIRRGQMDLFDDGDLDCEGVPA